MQYLKRFSYRNKLKMKQRYKIDDLKVISNPSEEIFTVSFGRELLKDYKYELIDCVGKKLLTGNFSVGMKDYELNVKDNVRPGIYVLRVYNDDERFITTIRKR